MLYPLYIHVGDARHAHGVTFPDFQGCFSAADSWEDLPGAVQEAVEAHFEGEESDIPLPTPIEQLVGDARFEGGVWMLFDIDLSKINTKAVRVNVSLPERLVQQIDAAAKNRHMTRSAFLALAAQHEMAHA